MAYYRGLFFLAAACGSCLLVASAVSAAAPQSPLKPRAAIGSMQVAPGLKVELAAAEPAVVDPVAVRFDATGRMWVVEMRDYPDGPAPGKPPQSRIRVLEDRNGDGVFETGVTFASGLVFPTGLQPWKGGAIVTLAGAVVYMKDTTGDGKCDHREVWYKGFAEDNTQLRANHPRLGLDLNVYIANGLRGGAVHNPREAGSAKLNLRGGDFRFNPHTFKYSMDSGAGQFGLTFDDFGNRFVCSNRNPLKHVVLTSDMLRNTKAAIAITGHDVAAAGASSRLYPVSRAWTTSTLHANQFTAACGVQLYRGSAMPSLTGVGMTCDPTGNLVHAERLKPMGATFSGTPLRKGVEFLASTDTWFRPVNLTTGPDGSLYVVDMYRAVIEHPQWMPAELRTRRDLLDGANRGRIYRVTAAAPQKPGAAYPHNLRQLKSGELVDLLSHPNSWQRDTAARLLFERQDQTTVAALRNLAKSSMPAAGRAWAISLLNATGDLTAADVQTALADTHPRIREQAVKTAAAAFRTDKTLRQRIAALHADSDARVRFNAAFALAPVENDEELAAVVRIAMRGASDEWTRRAVIVACGSRRPELAAKLLQQLAASKTLTAGDRDLLLQVAAPAANDRNLAVQMLETTLAAGAFPDVLKMQAAVEIIRTGLRQLKPDAVMQLLSPAAAKSFQSLLRHAHKEAGNAQAPTVERFTAIDMLAMAGSNAVLLELATTAAEPAVRLHAIAALARQADIAPWKTLLTGAAELSPAVRTAVINAVLQRRERISLLLDEIQAGRIRPAGIDRGAASRLLKYPDTKIRDRARQLLASAVPADRVKVLAAYQPALRLAGDAARGKIVFQKNCSNCHRIGATGVDVAPDIADSRTKSPAQLLGDILQPNRAIDAAYTGYTLVLEDGSVLNGVLADETSAAVTLKQPGGKQQVIARQDIEELRSSGASLMPDGLEKDINQQQMADLLKFIKHWRYLEEGIRLK